MTFYDPILNRVIQAIASPGPDEIAQVVRNFPNTIQQARSDWGKFLAGSKAGLFTEGQKKDILAWFTKLPDLWDGIKSNWVFTPQGLLKSNSGQGFYDETEKWIGKLRTHPSILFPGLGIGFLLIAGVIILATFGVAGAFWAVGYIKEQSNISRMIDGVVSGQLPPEVLKEAIAKEESSVFGDLKGLVMVTVAAGALFAFWPQISSLFKRAS